MPYWRALTYNRKACRFLGHWLRICDRTGGGELPDGYQHLGLRRLPQAENAPAPSDAALAGLERRARHLIGSSCPRHP